MKKHTVDMTKGSILRHIIAFAIPVMIAGVLQTLYNAADTVVVGKFAGKEALAAVGSTSSAINLLLGVFIGLSSATNVIVARKFGAGNKSGVSKAVHTAIAVCITGGVFLAVMGIVFCKKLLILMGSPEDVIDLSTLYMRIYFAGIPVVLLYNFGSAIMRAVGDAKRPTYYLMGAGLINVTLNLLFVIVFDMSVAGVALATIIAQAVSALLVLRSLVKTEECFKLDIKKIKIHKDELREMILLGVPAGIQGAMFSLSNVIIQSSINSCGSTVIAGNSAASSLEGIVYIAMNAFFHATLTFTGQNLGAHQFKRMRKGFWTSFCVSLIFGLTVSQLILWLSPLLLRMYTDSDTVIAVGVDRMSVICATYFLCGLMEVATGALRGLGVANRAMFTSLVGVCGVRLLMTYLGAPYKESSDLKFLFYSYPISWVITGGVLMIFFFTIVKSREKKWQEHLQNSKPL